MSGRLTSGRLTSRRRHGHRRKAFELPDTTDLDSVNAAQVALIRLVAQARLDAREALYISRMLEHRRRAIGTATLWQKMKELEAQGRQMRGEAP
jgi:hypothetical protein